MGNTESSQPQKTKDNLDTANQDIPINSNSSKESKNDLALEQEDIHLIELDNPPKDNIIIKTNTSETLIENKKAIKNQKKTSRKKTKEPNTNHEVATPNISSPPKDITLTAKDIQEVQEVLLYLDNLLAKLPKAKINQFAHSPQYLKYMAILRKLKI